MQVTPHLLIAGAVTLIVLVVTVPGLIGDGGSWQVTDHELRVVGPTTDTAVVPATRATDPVVPELAHLPDTDPFNPQAPGMNVTGVAAPPPPPLQLPSLPVLPAVVR